MLRTHLILVFSLLVFLTALSAQTANTGFLLQAGSAQPFGTSADNKLDRSGLAFRLGLDHATAPTFAGFYWILGGGFSHDRFRRTGTTSVSITPLPVLRTTEIRRGQKIRLFEASAYFGGGWSYRRFDLRVRGGLRYLLAAKFRGFDEVITDGTVTSSNFNVFRGGPDEELNGADGRYLIGFPDRYAIELGTDLFYEISSRWRIGASLTHVASPVAPVILYADFCTAPSDCPPLQSEPFRNYLDVYRTNVQLSLIFYPGN